MLKIAGKAFCRLVIVTAASARSTTENHRPSETRATD